MFGKYFSKAPTLHHHHHRDAKRSAVKNNQPYP